ncbi:MAG: bifunctional phosphoribosyl-AMP cyclohydrolase/phosphoribosyl-ATP diphosphatase HisIE [Candidatus Gastranaerophilales bacterium]|nr:bifunctional phosphoribosyl-AMP cyclohydrolase/phosphoribosyl-ATP diphosphatase HisIE [Candidatus Gastranaerophilales bacterium]
MLVASIDLMDGKAVQLQQGKTKVLERENVLELAKYYARFGEVAVIDLDCALNTGKNNEELIKKICKVAPCRVGGGIRTIEKAKKVLSWGARKIIIGTAASEEFLSKLPQNRTMVAIDSRDGKITTKGWQEVSEFTTLDYVKRFENYCCGFLFTIVEREGMMQGTNIDFIKEIASSTIKPITAAGGISSVEEIVELSKNNIDCQLGMAIYTGKINLEEAFCSCLNFEKMNGLIPTIVQDAKTRQVLMLAYSTPESLRKTFQTGLATYFSRSKNALWTKGETSGNTQELLNAKFDCDQDAILFSVNQKGNACHLDRYSCFEDKHFTFEELFDVINDRKEKMPLDSYTTKLFNDEFYLKRKIMEEAFETVNFEQGDGLAWEAADLLYHLSVFMVHHDVTIEDIRNNLKSRTK